MAIPHPDVLTTLTISDLTSTIVYDRSIFEDMFRKRKTVSDVEREVAKLKSVSAAGKRWIVDERCSWLGIGKYAGTFRVR